MDAGKIFVLIMTLLSIAALVLLELKSRRSKREISSTAVAEQEAAGKAKPQT